MTVVKDFFIENDSTWEVYYRLYLDNVSGGLSRVLTVTIKDGDKILYTGTANELTKQNVIAADDTLKIGQRRNLTVVFRLPRKQRQRNAEPRPHLYAVRRGNANEKTTRISCSGKKERTKQCNILTETDKCACCGCDRNPKDLPTSNRNYYIEGSRELCNKCYT